MYKVVVSTDGPVREFVFMDEKGVPNYDGNSGIEFIDPQGVRRQFGKQHVVCITYYPDAK